MATQTGTLNAGNQLVIDSQGAPVDYDVSVTGYAVDFKRIQQKNTLSLGPHKVDCSYSVTVNSGSPSIYKVQPNGQREYTADTLPDPATLVAGEAVVVDGDVVTATLVDSIPRFVGSNGIVSPKAPLSSSFVGWTPSLSPARLWYSAEDALNSSGLIAATGDNVTTIPNRVTSAVSTVDSSAMPLIPKGTNLAAGTSVNYPKKGGSGSTVNGYTPVSFGSTGTGTLTSRLGTQAGAITTGGATNAVHRVFAVLSLRGSVSGNPISVSSTSTASMVSTNTSKGVLVGTNQVQFGIFTDSIPFLMSIERPGTEQFIQNTVISANYIGRMNGVKTPASTTGTAAINPNVAFIVGNAAGADTASDMDMYEIVVVQGKMSQADIWRTEGYLAHKYGIQSSLPGDHPYRSAPPVVPSNVTQKLQFDVCAYNWGYRQVVDGYHFEIQGDNIGASDGAQGTDQSRCLPYDLKPSERIRLASLVKGAHSLRLALGIYWRGIRTTNATSGLGDTVGPRWPSQRKMMFDFINKAKLVGIAPEYWSPAPHWKTTSAYGLGTLWAGGSYARSVTLDSIRSSDATQYAAQIGLLTDAMLSDLEDLHFHDTYPMRVVGFGLQNEATDNTAAYGSCLYTVQLYVDVLKVITPKIRNSAKLSSWGGNKNTVKIHITSWDGILDSIGTVIRADSTVLSTGKTAMQEVAGWTYHRFGELNANANAIISTDGSTLGGLYGAYIDSTKNPTNIPVYNNEYEFLSGTYPGRTAWFNNLLMVWLNNLNYLQAPQVTLIHAAKPSTDPVSERYALASWRVPGDNGTPVDYASSIDYGEFAINDNNFNAAKPFITTLTNAQYLLTTETVFLQNQRVGAWLDKNGKLVVAMLNASSSSYTGTIGIGNMVRNMNCYSYSVTSRDVYVGNSNTNVLNVTIPGNTLYVWYEV